MTVRLLKMPARLVLFGTALVALSLTTAAPASASLFPCGQNARDCAARCERLSGERQRACLALCPKAPTSCKPQKWGSKWPWKHPRHPWPFPRPPKKGDGPMAGGGGKPGSGPGRPGGPGPRPIPRGESMFRGGR
jgi:hypothetical protein